MSIANFKYLIYILIAILTLASCGTDSINDELNSQATRVGKSFVGNLSMTIMASTRINQQDAVRGKKLTKMTLFQMKLLTASVCANGDLLLRIRLK